MDITKIVFPVYQLPYKISREGSQSFILNRNGEKVYLDDTSISSPFLGIRRLILSKMNKLIPLKVAIFFLKDLIKLSNSEFIDTAGIIFKYTKTRFVPLEFKKITKVIKIKTGGTLIEVDNEFVRYKIMYAPTPHEQYAGLLRIGINTYMIYGLYTELHNSTRRKI